MKKEGIYMVKYRDVYDRVLPESKRASDRQNIVLAMIVRPISIYLTLPLLETNVKATTVTKISVVASLVGFLLLSFGHNVALNVLGWFCFFTWAVLDCVDGNIARYKDQCSDMGELWDAFGGYVAMVLTYFGGGVAAFFDQNRITFCEPYELIVLGGATAIMSILPRMIMHKKREMGGKESTKRFTNKQEFGIARSLAHNFVSLIGLFQFVFLFCIVFHLLNVWIAVYFVANLGMMLVSLSILLKE